MRNLPLLTTLSLCIAAISCTNLTDPDTDAAANATVDACASFTPCGGDLEGNWTISTGCYSFMTVSGRPIIPSCPAATVEYLPDAAGGSFAFGRDGRYTGDFDLVGRVIFTIPASCLATDAGCDGFEDLVEGRSCTLTADRTCRCTDLLELGTDGPQSGGYTLQGSLIEFSNDIPMTYCAQSDRLTIETVSQVEMGDTVDGRLRFVLERQ